VDVHRSRLERLSVVGRGVRRPEDVHVTADGRVYVSDADAALSEVRADGSLRRIGSAGGEPNGFALIDDRTAVIANFALGRLQRLDLETGSVETFLDHVGEAPLGAVNYPVADKHGRLWVSSSARRDPLVGLATGEPDGFIFVVEGDGRAQVAVEHIAWPNCMTFDVDHRYLYVCRSAHSDVMRFAIADGELGAPERYGPPLGGRTEREFGLEQSTSFGDPATLQRWALADGCAFDRDGNLWVTLMSANRIVMITPEQTVVDVHHDPGGDLVTSPTSIAFGGDGRDVYIGSLTADYVVKARYTP
jgi:gluconolactonase